MMESFDNQLPDRRAEDAALDWKRELVNWIQIIVTASLIAFVLTTFVIANSRVPSGSMENTIITDDRVIGFRLAYLFQEPQRGDIVIFRWPDNEEVYFVKRIIGLPGDRIDIKSGRVYLNGASVPLNEPYIREPMETEPPQHFEVPKDCYFMMGDNRNYSLDARKWTNTYVSKDQLVAKVLFSYYPNPRLIR